MGNLFAESALNPKNLQNTYEKSLKLTDAEYTRRVDDGSYTNFVKDKAGYGLAQWTYWSRKQNLLNFAKSQGKSIGDLNMQLDFLYKELTTGGYKTLWNNLKTATSVLEASNQVLFNFERPADQSEKVQAKRASYGQEYYDMFAAASSAPTIGMKYSDANPPMTCIMTNSSCYKAGKTIPVYGVLWHSTGANNPNLRRYVQPSMTDPNYQTLINKIGYNTGNTHWNQDISAGLNAWIGKLNDGSVTSIQALPWNHRPWGCYKGPNGSLNNGWIQFEICEDNLDNKDYFDKVYEEACQLTAYLCKKFNLDPLGTVTYNGKKVPVITCHSEAYTLGFASNHADVMHWFPKYGKSMETVKKDVAKIMEGDKGMIKFEPVTPNFGQEDMDMTQEQFNVLMNNWIAAKANEDASAWSAEAREWAERNGLVQGDEKGRKMYKKMLNREELITVLYRALHRNIID